jgi:hypothetical protein
MRHPVSILQGKENSPVALEKLDKLRFSPLDDMNIDVWYNICSLFAKHLASFQRSEHIRQPTFYLADMPIFSLMCVCIPVQIWRGLRWIPNVVLPIRYRKTCLAAVMRNEVGFFMNLSKTATAFLHENVLSESIDWVEHPIQPGLPWLQLF